VSPPACRPTLLLPSPPTLSRVLAYLSFQEEAADSRSRRGQEAVEGAVYLCKFFIRESWALVREIRAFFMFLGQVGTSVAWGQCWVLW
jgi:hypothetical protein